MNLKQFGTGWITTEKDLLYIADKLDDSKHFDLIPRKNRRLIRNAELVERKAGAIIEWKKNNPHT